MDKLGKVMKGLGCCSQGAKEPYTPTIRYCAGCPYLKSKIPCTRALARDALELLKEQEPRVMTLDEVKKLPEGTDVWIQHAGKFADDVIRAATVSEVTNASISFWFGGSLYYMNYGEKPYGWICWTSKPTDEQREAVKWGE